jgi:hypothetical protein
MEFDPFRQWQQALAGLWAPAPPGPAGFGSFAAAAEQFNAAAASFLSSQARAPVPAAGAAAIEAFQRFLREQFGALRMPWSVAGRAGFGPGPSAGPDVLALGAGREGQQRLQRIAEAAAAIEAAQRRLQLLWADALREAADAYCKGLVTSVGDATPEALQGLYDRWIDCAEEAYARMAHSETYANALADYVNAGSRWRAEMQGCFEQWAKVLDLPTRAEVNTLLERVNALEAAARRPRRSRRSGKT